MRPEHLLHQCNILSLLSMALSKPCPAEYALPTLFVQAQPLLSPTCSWNYCRFPHLMQLCVPQASLHTSLFLRARCNVSASFGAISSPPFHCSTCACKCAANSSPGVLPIVLCACVLSVFLFRNSQMGCTTKCALLVRCSEAV